MKSKPAISRIEFNRQAKQLRADDNLPALMTLAVKIVGSPRDEDLRQILHLAAGEVISEWWNNGGKLPYDRVMKAARAAARNFRGKGGYRNDNVWRGGYDSERRKYGSQIMGGDVVARDPATLAELAALAAEMRHNLAAEFAPSEEPDAESPADDTTDERDLRDIERERIAADRLAEARAEEGGTNIATSHAAVSEGSAESTSHDGGHADAERLNARDDGETAYGIEGATRGLHSGGRVPSAYLIAWQTALETECSHSDRAFLLAIDKAGGFENWVGKDGNRKAARAKYEARRDDIEKKVRRRAVTILEAAGDLELQAAWLSAQPTGEQRGYRAVRDQETGKYRAEQVPVSPTSGTSNLLGGVLSAAWPKEPLTRPRGRHFAPVPMGRLGLFRVGGYTWADQVRNVKAWEKRGRSLRALGWGEPFVVITRSLLDG